MGVRVNANQAYWLNLIVLAVVLQSDIGRKKVTAFRVLRPVATAIALVPFFYKGGSTSGNGLYLEIGGTVLGLLLGYIASLPMTFEYDTVKQRVYSRAGLAFFLSWAVLTGAKMLYSYGAIHWYGHQLGTWLYHNHISVDALRAAFIFLSVASAVSRVAVIARGERRVKRQLQAQGGRGAALQRSSRSEAAL
jgi:hypothetical protein